MYPTFRDSLEAVGGDAAQGDDVITGLAELGDQGGLGAGQDDVGDAALLLRFHERAPVVGIAVFLGELLFAFVVIAPVAADVAAVGHVIGRFAEEKLAAHFFPPLAHDRVGDDLERISSFSRCVRWGFRLFSFIIIPVDAYSFSFNFCSMYSAINLTVFSFG